MGGPSGFRLTPHPLRLTSYGSESGDQCRGGSGEQGCEGEEGEREVVGAKALLLLWRTKSNP